MSSNTYQTVSTWIYTVVDGQQILHVIIIAIIIIEIKYARRALVWNACGGA